MQPSIKGQFALSVAARPSVRAFMVSLLFTTCSVHCSSQCSLNHLFYETMLYCSSSVHSTWLAHLQNAAEICSSWPCTYRDVNFGALLLKTVIRRNSQFLARSTLPLYWYTLAYVLMFTVSFSSLRRVLTYVVHALCVHVLLKYFMLMCYMFKSSNIKDRIRVSTVDNSSIQESSAIAKMIARCML